MHDPHEHDRYRPGEVQRVRRLVQNRPGITQVRVKVAGGTRWTAGEQRPCVYEHDRVVVDVDNSSIGVYRLRHLMGVVRGGDTGADVQELPDPPRTGQVAHHPGQQRAVSPNGGDDRGISLDDRITSYPVSSKVVLPAEPIVIYPGHMGLAGIKIRRDPAGAAVRVITAVARRCWRSLSHHRASHVKCAQYGCDRWVPDDPARPTEA